MTLNSWLRLCWWSSCLHLSQFYVVTSFVSHFFSSGCNLSSTLQHISSNSPIFQVTTSSWCRNLNFFCSALLQVATLLSGRDIRVMSRHEMGPCVLKTSCNLFLWQRPLLWLHRRILVVTSEWCRDIIYILLASRHRNDVVT